MTPLASVAMLEIRAVENRALQGARIQQSASACQPSRLTSAASTVIFAAAIMYLRLHLILILTF